MVASQVQSPPPHVGTDASREGRETTLRTEIIGQGEHYGEEGGETGCPLVHVGRGEHCGWRGGTDRGVRGHRVHVGRRRRCGSREGTRGGTGCTWFWDSTVGGGRDTGTVGRGGITRVEGEGGTAHVDRGDTAG